MTATLSDGRTDSVPELVLPEEPLRLKLKVRGELEADPEFGNAKVADALFIARRLWREWGEELRGCGMQRRDFFAIARGYAPEIRLWVVGERPWEHCVSGLSGRVKRRVRPRE